MYAESPSVPDPPVLSGTAGIASVNMTWAPTTTAAIPAEKYTLFCMASTATSCNYANKVGTTTAVDVANTTTSGTVNGLTAGTSYKCCIMSRNSAATVYSTVAALTTSSK